MKNAAPKAVADQNKSFKKAQRRAAESKGIGQSQRGPIPQLELYQMEYCPFSHAVRSQLDRLGLDYVAHTVPSDEPLKHEQLVQAGGKDQVPFLIDHSTGVKMYESEAINAYLEKTYGHSGSESRLGRLTQAVGLRLKRRADLLAWRLGGPLLRAQDLRVNARGRLRSIGNPLTRVRDWAQAAINEARHRKATGSA